MKKLFFIMAMAFSTGSQAADVQIQWDKSLDQDKISTYRVYTKKSIDASWSVGKDVGIKTEHLLKNVPAGKTIVAVTAFSDDLGESLKSNEVIAISPPSAPTGLRIVVTIDVK